MQTGVQKAMRLDERSKTRVTRTRWIKVALCASNPFRRFGPAMAFASCLATLATLDPGHDARAESAPHVRIRGGAHVDAHLTRDAGHLVLSGSIVDDAQRP